jgi:hypothetical protein
LAVRRVSDRRIILSDHDVEDAHHLIDIGSPQGSPHSVDHYPSGLLRVYNWTHIKKAALHLGEYV